MRGVLYYSQFMKTLKDTRISLAECEKKIEWLKRQIRKQWRIRAALQTCQTALEEIEARDKAEAEEAK